MYPLFTSEQSIRLDRMLIEAGPISGYELICRAAQACMDQTVLRWGFPKSVLIFVGTGNNGGDGYALGRLLATADCAVSVVEVFGVPQKEDVVTARQSCLDAGVNTLSLESVTIFDADVIIDAIMGTGLSRPLSDELIALVERINRSELPVLAVDIPSGLSADTGCVMPTAINADVTVTFIVRKQGLYTGDARDFCGDIVYADLGVDLTAVQASPNAWLFDSHETKRLPRRRYNSHKGDYGHVLVVGGDFGMAGAVRLAGEAALACGAGLVSIATRPEHAAAIAAACPVLMAHGITVAAELDPLLVGVDTIVVGPGLGIGEWARTLFKHIMRTPQTKVIDAGALTLLAEEGMAVDRNLDQCVLTPHPGEAARLLQSSSSAIQADRFAAGREIVSHFGGICVLKGSGTVICSAEKIFVCLGGNPAMATAGMGDVLSGIISALIAQGQTPLQAAQGGVGWHARVGDEAAAYNVSVLLASAMIDRLQWPS